VVETHDPSFVRAMHGDQAERVFAMPVDGLEDVTAKSALYDDAMWRVEFEWSDGPRRRSALEFSRLTEPDELERLAAHAGLVPADRWAAWTSHTSPSGRTPTYISTFLRPAAGSAVES
jgi:hypothetical protein